MDNLGGVKFNRIMIFHLKFWLRLEFGRLRTCKDHQNYISESSGLRLGLAMPDNH